MLDRERELMPLLRPAGTPVTHVLRRRVHAPHVDACPPLADGRPPAVRPLRNSAPRSPKTEHARNQVTASAAAAVAHAGGQNLGRGSQGRRPQAAWPAVDAACHAPPDRPPLSRADASFWTSASTCAPPLAIDPCSSGPHFSGWQRPPRATDVPSAIALPCTWMARAGWRRAGGPLRPEEHPAVAPRPHPTW